MAARPLPPESLMLIAALREALAGQDDVQERTLFGSYCFFVAGKLCLGVKNGELLVRLPPGRHQEFLEMQNTRELSPDITSRLHKARQKALDRQKVPVGGLSLAGIGNRRGGGGERGRAGVGRHGCRCRRRWRRTDRHIGGIRS